MQIAITTKNVAALAAFYRDVVGLKHLFDAGPNLSFFDLGGVRLAYSPTDHTGIEFTDLSIIDRNGRFLR